VKQRRVAAPYAKALFGLAKERNQTELVGRELGDVAATFESDLDLRDFLARPWIPAMEILVCNAPLFLTSSRIRCATS
jgi:F0F1-type ATP synthase delta subunit